MSMQAPVINELDRSRLKAVIEKLRSENFNAPWANGDALETKLAAAAALPPPEVPADLVTMNSVVRVRDTETGREERYTLVFPSESRPLEGKVSALSTLGLALFGARIGDTVEWNTPKGTRRMQVIALEYQPEAAKDWSR